MEVRKRKRKWVWAVAIMLLLLLLAAASAPVLYVSQSKQLVYIGTGTFEVSLSPGGSRGNRPVFVGPEPGGGSGSFTCKSGHMPITVGDVEVQIMECSP